MPKKHKFRHQSIPTVRRLYTMGYVNISEILIVQRPLKSCETRLTPSARSLTGVKFFFFIKTKTACAANDRRARV